MKTNRIMLFLTGFLTACTPTPTPILLVTLAQTDIPSPAPSPSTAKPTPDPMPTPTASLTPLPSAPTAVRLSPTPTATPTPAVERILFAPGATEVTVEGCLPVNESKVYVMHVAAGQFVEMNAPGGAMGQGLCFSIVGPDGVVVKPMGDYPFRGVVPSTQDSSNPLCSGDITVVVNYNLDANGEGPKWGTFTWKTPLDAPYTGGFQGTFSGWAGLRAPLDRIRAYVPIRNKRASVQACGIAV